MKAERRTRLWQALRYVIGIVGAGVGLAAVFGRRDELAGAVSVLGHLSWPWVILAAAAEGASVAAYARLYRHLLTSGPTGQALSVRTLTGITLAAHSIQNSLPAGPAWSNLYTFRQFSRRGADPVVAAWSLVMANVLAFCALGLLATVGVVAADDQASALGLIPVVVGVVLVGLGLVVALRRGILGRPALALARGGVRLSQRVAHRPTGDPEEIVRQAWGRLSAVHPTRADLVKAAAWALANWVFDLTSLALAFGVVGSPVPWRGLLLAYGAGQLAANLPLTLGGLGVVEGSLTVALVYYGGAESATVAAVLLYRILSFWLMLPVGWAAALVLRVPERAGRRSGTLPAASGVQP